jgi:hypothetical protein
MVAAGRVTRARCSKSTARPRESRRQRRSRRSESRQVLQVACAEPLRSFRSGFVLRPSGRFATSAPDARSLAKVDPRNQRIWTPPVGKSNVALAANQVHSYIRPVCDGSESPSGHHGDVRTEGPIAHNGHLLTIGFLDLLRCRPEPICHDHRYARTRQVSETAWFVPRGVRCCVVAPARRPVVSPATS